MTPEQEDVLVRSTEASIPLHAGRLSSAWKAAERGEFGPGQQHGVEVMSVSMREVLGRLGVAERDRDALRLVLLGASLAWASRTDRPGHIYPSQMLGWVGRRYVIEEARARQEGDPT